jgi:hypothetical protein
VIALAAIVISAAAIRAGMASHFEALPPPAGEVLLTITGKIHRTNAPERADFDRTMLESLGLTTVQTSTPWTDGVPVFRGVLARDLLAAVGADGDIARAVALNDYVYDIPATDFQKYEILLALEKNGEPLRVRNKGPIWIIYPLDQFDTLRNRTTERKMVWHLTRLEIR